MAQQRDRGLVVIGVLKLAKGVLLLGLGVVALFLHRSGLTDHLQKVVGQIGLHPGASFLRAATGKVLGLSPHDAMKLGLALVIYAALFATEGTALLAGWRWAHGFAIGVTGSFIPLEIYELVREPRVTRALVLASNIAIVVYLVVRLRQKRRRR